MKRNTIIISILAMAATTAVQAVETADSVATDTVVEVLNPH